MSRTKRQVWYTSYFRTIKTQQSRKMEQFAHEQLKEAGFDKSNRQKSRTRRAIPTSWDDLKIAAMYEMDYLNGPLRNYQRVWY